MWIMGIIWLLDFLRRFRRGITMLTLVGDALETKVVWWIRVLESKVQIVVDEASSIARSWIVHAVRSPPDQHYQLDK